VGEVVTVLALGQYTTDVLDALLRWLHVVAGIAWIGASFYFIRLDLGLRSPKDPADAEAGVAGEYWGVHGGGFYHSQKYKVAPEVLPEPLNWFKWEAYTTWISGFALLVVLYYFHSDVRLIDPQVADLSSWQAIALSAGGIAAGWVVYDLLCRFVRDDRVLAVCVAALVVLAAWGYGELFAARASYLQVGATIGTIMVANVFFTIIPAHRELIRAKEAGRDPDAAPGLEAKRRSVHNNYLTLPVVFTMLAGHFPFTWSHEHAWLVLVAIMALAALLRHFFNLLHVGRRVWWIPVVVAVGAVAVIVWLRPADTETAPGTSPVPFARVQQIVTQRCVPCHAGASAPNGVRLDGADAIRARLGDIERMAVRTRAMPPANATKMTEQERQELATFIASR
jgi:uncharacterized membrane protein